MPVARHAGRGQPGQLAGVAADLVRVVDVDADQLEVGVLEHAAERAGADVAGGPLDDPEPSHRTATPESPAAQASSRSGWVEVIQS